MIIDIFSEVLNTLGSLVKRRANLRTVLFIISVVIVTSGYYYVANFFNLDISHLQLPFISRTYKFYSGSPGGFYIHIGNSLAQASKNKRTIKIINNTTAGSFENALKVMTSHSAFGIIQEESILQDVHMREKIRFIAPLYMSRLHLIYNIESFSKFVLPDQKDSVPYISTMSNAATLAFFANAKINGGPIGNSSSIISDYLLAELRGQLDEKDIYYSQFTNHSDEIAYQLLWKGDLDIIFTSVGAPIIAVDSLLSSGKFGLMGIGASMVSILYEKYGVNVRLTNFADKYRNLPPTSTIGSYAFLITSKDVPNNDILRVLEMLKSNIPLIKRLAGLKEQRSFQLDEFDFLESFHAEHNKNIMEKLRDLFFFIVSIIVSTAIVITILLWFISSYKQNKHFIYISRVAKDVIPANTTIGFMTNEQLNQTEKNQSNKNKQDAVFPIPIQPENKKDVIIKLVQGIRNLYAIRLVINDDYRNGGITDNHHVYLLDHENRVNLKLRHILAQQLNAYFRKYQPISIEELRAYYSSGYLLKEDYYTLMDRHY